MHYRLITTLLLSLSLTGYAQDTIPHHTLTYSGYLRYVGNSLYTNGPEGTSNWQWLHHRINLNYNPTTHITTVAEIRTRVFQGEFVRLHPELRANTTNPNDFINMDAVIKTSDNSFILSRIDRLYIDYTIAHWKIRTGRQRINWGSATFWNPNDIFNAYDLLDVDYAEKSGTDAIHITRSFRDFSQLEIAYAPTNETQKPIAAAKLGMNSRGYDLSLIGGNFHDYRTAGVGWAGSTGDAGFRGEIQYFSKHGAPQVLNMELEWDYLFFKSWYAGIAGMYCSSGTTLLQAPFQINAFRISPMQTMPFKWNSAFRIQKIVNALLSADLFMIYAPQTHYLIIYPTLNYSVSNSIDISIAGQTALITSTTDKTVQNGSLFVCAKWSY